MRPSQRRLAALPAFALSAAALAAGLTAGATGTAHAADTFTVQTLHFAVHVGPDGSQACDIVGDLYLPADASPTHRVPAILTTNGFGGSKADQTGTGTAFAQRDYAVLSYSGLGFGGSGCKITLDDPDWDGVAGSQLISYLGGATGIAFTDAAHTAPAPALDVVVQDTVAHNGQSLPNDPRVGMVGGSYGGQVQFAVASVDPRLDTIVPIITWNDLSYSLGPNNTSQSTGVTSTTPGVTKLSWGLGFVVSGLNSGVQNVSADPARVLPCPNFATFVCPALVTAGGLGYFDPASIASLRHASVASYLPKITIPTLLMQGETDTLFNLNESIANYQALKAQGTPVKLVWHSWGHSGSTPAPGEFNLGSADPSAYYETARISDWFDHYLRDSAVSTGPEFAYFRNWVSYTGNAAPAYATSSTFPVGTVRRYYLSGTGLVTSPLLLAVGTQSLLTTPAPTNTSPLDALSAYVPLPVAENDLPGTTSAWSTAALGTAVDLVGAPRLTLQVCSLTAALTQALGASGDLVLFVRLQDVAPDGTASDINQQIAPVRIPDVTKPFTVTLPALVHRFAAGHKIRLVVSASSVNYRGGLGTNLVSITTGSSAQALELPTVG